MHIDNKIKNRLISIAQNYLMKMPLNFMPINCTIKEEEIYVKKKYKIKIHKVCKLNLIQEEKANIVQTKKSKFRICLEIGGILGIWAYQEGQ